MKTAVNNKKVEAAASAAHNEKYDINLPYIGKYPNEMLYMLIQFLYRYF